MCPSVESATSDSIFITYVFGGISLFEAANDVKFLLVYVKYVVKSFQIIYQCITQKKHMQKTKQKINE